MTKQHNLKTDVVVVGSGPNGLAAAIRMAKSGLSVEIFEAAEEFGGGLRSEEVTLPGFVHDLCSAVHPLAAGSPCFSGMSLEEHGLQWVHPPLPLAHPLDDGTAVYLDRSIEKTAGNLGPDGAAWRRLMGPLANKSEWLLPDILQPLVHWPQAPWTLGKFGIRASRPATSLAQAYFDGTRARALFAGLAAHSFLPLDSPVSAAFGLVLGFLAHSVGWPLARGGSREVARALVKKLRAHGGEVITGKRVEARQDLAGARIVLWDLTPRQIVRIMGEVLPPNYRRRLDGFRYGPGVFKVDYALSQPVPWRARKCALAGTVHVGGTLEEIALGERATCDGKHAERPFVLFAQPSLFDPSRAPAGRHIGWAYCHVPNGSEVDMTCRIEDQIERFAPGFRDCVLARHTSNCAQLEARNPNLVGGDINGGAIDWWQLISRPTLFRPYALPIPGAYLCSSSTPPGGGVHGMCGWNAAGEALKWLGNQ